MYSPATLAAAQLYISTAILLNVQYMRFFLIKWLLVECIKIDKILLFENFIVNSNQNQIEYLQRDHSTFANSLKLL